MTAKIGNNAPEDAGQVAERLKAPVSKTGRTHEKPREKQAGRKVLAPFLRTPESAGDWAADHAAVLFATWSDEE